MGSVAQRLERDPFSAPCLHPKRGPMDNGYHS